MRLLALLCIPSLLVAQADTGTYRGLLRYATGRVDTVTLTLQPIPECERQKPAWIWCDDFEADRLGRYAAVNNANGRFVRIVDVGRNGSFGLSAQFDPSEVNAGWLELNFGRIPKGPPSMTYAKPVDAGTADYRQIYWRFYVRTNPDWTGGNGEKLTRATVYANTNRAQAMAAHAWGGRPADFVLDPASGTDAEGNLRTTRWNDSKNMRWLGNYKAATSLFGTNGAWECVEFMVKLNDAGRPNGEFWFWKNGVVQASRTNLNWLGGFNAYGLNAIRIENWWLAPKVQSRYLDNFVVSTERIGC